jgi:hypothetical protein
MYARQLQKLPRRPRVRFAIDLWLTGSEKEYAAASSSGEGEPSEKEYAAASSSGEGEPSTTKVESLARWPY